MKNYFNDEVEYIKQKDVEYIKFKKVEKYNNLECIFTLKSMDFKVAGKGEDFVKAEYERICRALNVDSSNIVVPKQTHTNIVKVLNDEVGIYPKSLIEVDGIVTNKKNKILSLTFADCTPIALFDPVNNAIGNIHSGWKGSLNSIAIEAVKKMKEEFNSNEKDIICIIGPTIRKCHFEVEDDVRSLFYEKYKELENINEIITIGRVVDGIQKYNIDTVMLNKTMLLKNGIKEENIIDCNICTVCGNDSFHSFRKEKENAGRATLIMYLK